MNMKPASVRKKKVVAHEVRALDPRRSDWSYCVANVIERNGSLTYVQFADGYGDWLAPFEVQQT